MISAKDLNSLQENNFCEDSFWQELETFAVNNLSVKYYHKNVPMQYKNHIIDRLIFFGYDVEVTNIINSIWEIRISWERFATK